MGASQAKYIDPNVQPKCLTRRCENGCRGLNFPADGRYWLKYCDECLCPINNCKNKKNKNTNRCKKHYGVEGPTRRCSETNIENWKFPTAPHPSIFIKRPKS